MCRMGIFEGGSAHIKNPNYLFHIILNGLWFVEILSLIFTFLDVLCPSSSEKWFDFANLVECMKHLYEFVLKLGKI